MSENAEKALENLFGIRGFSHRATPLTKKLLQDADLVIAMTEHHKALIRQAFGQNENVIAMPTEIGDPFGGTLPLYEACARSIAESIETLIREGVIRD